MKFYFILVLVLFSLPLRANTWLSFSSVYTPWGKLEMHPDTFMFSTENPYFFKIGALIERYSIAAYFRSADGDEPLLEWYSSNPSVVTLVPSTNPGSENMERYVFPHNYGTALVVATAGGAEYNLDCLVIIPFPADYVHLKTLSIAGHAFPGGFHADTTVYSMMVPSSTDSINIAAEANTYPGVTVTGAGTKTLSAGDNVFPITVNSGSDEHADKTYTINIHRKSNDASLKYFSADGSELPLDRFTHNITVPHATGTFKIIAEANYSLAAISGDTGYNILNVGDNTFTVTVTAEEGNTLTYTINVHRKSIDASLKSFTLNNGNIPFGFNPATLNYTVSVSNSVTGIAVAAAANYGLATVAGTGNKTLNVGDTTFTVTVTPEEGLPKTYTITVHRKSIDATLKSFTLNNGNIPFGFNPATPDYAVTVSNSVSSIMVAAAANYPLSAVDGDTGNKTLNVGDNLFSVTVTPEEGQPKTYTVTVHRKSIDATLQSLTVDGQSVSSSFVPSHLNYQIAVENAVSVIALEAFATYPLATVTGTGNKTLNVGDNPFSVTVTPEEGQPKTYTIVIHRKSIDATLQSLTMSNTLNGSNIPMEYDPKKLTCTATVPVSVKNITLHARANHSAAFVTGHTGIQSLRPGRNIFHITVTAEDGTVKIHPVIINVISNVII
jgi:hypothetical protein